MFCRSGASRGSEILFGLMTLGVFMPGQMVLLPWARVLG